MEVLFVLVPISAVLMAIAIYVFIRAVDSGQFDNLDQHALDILEEHEVQEHEYIDR